MKAQLDECGRRIMLGNNTGGTAMFVGIRISTGLTYLLYGAESFLRS